MIFLFIFHWSYVNDLNLCNLFTVTLYPLFICPFGTIYELNIPLWASCMPLGAGADTGGGTGGPAGIGAAAGNGASAGAATALPYHYNH